MEPIFLRRSVRAASGLPEFIGDGRDVSMSECREAMFIRGRLSPLRRVRGILQGLPRMFVSRQVILFSVLFGNTMCVRGAVVQLGSSLVVFEL